MQCLTSVQFRLRNYLFTEGPGYGYFPKPRKTVLAVKKGLEEVAKSMVPDIQVTSLYQKKENRILLEKKMNKWEQGKGCKRSICYLIAEREPQAAYSVFIYGNSKRWVFTARTTPNASKLLRHLDSLLNETFLQTIIGKESSQIP